MTTNNNTSASRFALAPASPVPGDLSENIGWYEEETQMFTGESVWGSGFVAFQPDKEDIEVFVSVCARLGLSFERKVGRNGYEYFLIEKCKIEDREVYKVWCHCGSCDPESRWYIW